MHLLLALARTEGGRCVSCRRTVFSSPGFYLFSLAVFLLHFPTNKLSHRGGIQKRKQQQRRWWAGKSYLSRHKKNSRVITLYIDKILLRHERWSHLLMATKNAPCQLRRWKPHHHSLLLEQGGQINHLLVVMKNAMTTNVIAGRQQMTSMAPLTPPPPPPMAPKHRHRQQTWTTPMTPTNPMASIRKIPTATNRQTIKHQILSKISVTGFLS